MQNIEIEKFSAMVSKWKGAYACAVQSYVGLNTPQGEKLLLYGKTVFEPFQSGINHTPFSFETEHIFARRFVQTLKSDDVSNMIDVAKNGKLGEFAILSPKKQPEPFSYHLSPKYHPLASTLFVSGETRHSIVTQANFPQYVDWEMKSADVPFENLDELLEHCGLPHWESMAGETRLELVAKAPGLIDRHSIIKDGNGIIKCRIAGALDVKQLKIGTRVFDKNREITRESIRGNQFEWDEEGDYRIGKCEFNTGDSSILEAYLSYNGIPLDQSSVNDPTKHLNPRYAIHQFFDPRNDLLPQMLLKPEKDVAHVFEGAVSALLTLLGFSVSNYGRFPKLQEGPDIIAITPDGHVAIVECTIAAPNQKNKITKLVQRTRSIQDMLATAGYGDREIQPVSVTLCSQKEVSPDLAVAGAHGIAVVCKENLEDALTQIELPLNADRYFNHLKKLIPPSQDESPMGF